MNQGVLSFMLLFSLVSCGTSTTFLPVKRNPDLKLPTHIVKLAGVDRSQPASEAVSFLEGVFTGENLGQDRMARSAIFSSLNIIMNDQDRFDYHLSTTKLQGSKGGTHMIDPLDAATVQGIATKEKADALLVLEAFDSDTRNIVTTGVEVTSTVTTGINPLTYANNVRTSWRIYDGATGLVMDEFSTFMSDDGWWAYADAPSSVDRQRVIEGADAAAYQMAGRIVPVEVYLERIYYKNAGFGNRKLKQSARYIKANRFNNAKEIWNDLYHSDASNKVRGRAAFNMALWHEHEGDINGALHWVDEAIALGNKKAVTYGALLSERLVK